MFKFFAKAVRFYHTVKYLRWSQVIYRLKYKFFPLRPFKIKKFTPVINNWIWQGPEVIEQSFFNDGVVCFLNTTASFEDYLTWNDARFEKLWLYNLNYFDDLNASNNSTRHVLQYEHILRWIKENPLPEGNAWEPYPLSLRLVNWIKWYKRSGIHNQLIENSITEQAFALSKQLEYHILGNHLFANAKALVFVGCFMKGKEADVYLNLGLKILKEEVPEQFLADGGHFELSPMYHCILLWDLLDLINLAQITGNKVISMAVANWIMYAEKALVWLNKIIHPDANISFFNDCAIGIAATPQQIFDYAESIGIFVASSLSAERLQTLSLSGYSTITMPDHWLIFDHAQVGPDYLPGHAHADTLSFEWSVGLQRIFVNSGTSVYGVGTERLRQRKTAAHNTVVVNGMDSSEVWDGFRVARRAKVTLEKIETTEELISLTASHDGYCRLPDKVVHRRSISMMPSELKIKDVLVGSYHGAVAHFHLHPDVDAVQSDDMNIILTAEGKMVNFHTSFACRILESSWHPRFGQSVASLKIEVEFRGAELDTSVILVRV